MSQAQASQWSPFDIPRAPGDEVPVVLIISPFMLQSVAKTGIRDAWQYSISAVQADEFFFPDGKRRPDYTSAVVVGQCKTRVPEDKLLIPAAVHMIDATLAKHRADLAEKEAGLLRQRAELLAISYTPQEPRDVDA